MNPPIAIAGSVNAGCHILGHAVTNGQNAIGIPSVARTLLDFYEVSSMIGPNQVEPIGEATR